MRFTIGIAGKNRVQPDSAVRDIKVEKPFVNDCETAFEPD
jgi:hypothetical protein